LATGIYTTNQAEACHFVAHNAKCNIIVVENEAQLRKIRQVWDRLPDLKAVIQYSGQPINEPGSPIRVYSVSRQPFLSLNLFLLFLSNTALTLLWSRSIKMQNQFD
jgi:hypothetical protein